MYHTLEKNLNAFVHTQVAELYYGLLTAHDGLKELKAQKALQFQKMIETCDAWEEYEALENAYITILTEEIYKQAFCDFAEIQAMRKNPAAE